MRKKFALMFALVLAALAVTVGLSACSMAQSDEDKAKAATEKCIAAIVAADDERAAEMLGENLAEIAGNAGVSTSDITKALFSHLKTEVSPATVEGAFASCDVTITNSDIPQALKNYYNNLNEWSSTADLTALINEGEDALGREVLNILIESVGSDELEQKTSTFTALLVQDSDGSWRVDNEDALADALMMNANLNSLF